jgi:gas vesicle structural protein
VTVQTSSRRSGGGYLERPAPSGLADVVETILDKGIVIDAYVRVSLVGIELLTVDARIVIASVDTYLRFAEATNRLDLYEQGGKDLTEAIGDLQESGASGKVSGAVSGVKKALTSSSRDDDDDDDDREPERERPRKRSSSARKRSSSRG